MSEVYFGKVDLAVLDDNQVSSTDKVLFGILCTLAKQWQNRKIRACCVTIKYLSELLGRSERTVQKSLRTLIDRGVIIRKPQFVTIDGHKQQTKSLFIIVGSQAECYPDTARQGFYFAKVMADVLTDPSLKIAHKFLYMVLCGIVDTRTGDITSYVRTIADKMNVSLSYVYRGIKVLSENGFLNIFHNFVGNTCGLSASTYSLNAPNRQGEDDDFGQAPLTKTSPQRFRTYYSRQDTTDTAFQENYGAGHSPLPLSDIQRQCLAYLDGQSLPFEGEGASIPSQEEPETPRLSSKERKLEIARQDINSPDVPENMRPLVEYMFAITGRRHLYGKEITALHALSQHDTPKRIKDEIDRAVKKFIAQGKTLQCLFFGYIWASLKNQRPTFNTGLTVEERTNAEEILKQRQERKQEIRRDLAQVRRENEAAKKKAMAESTPETTEPEAKQTAINSEQEKAKKLERKPRRQQSLEDAIKQRKADKAEATDYVLQQFSDDPNAAEILKSSLERGACSVRDILSAKKADLTCVNCPGEANCPYTKDRPTLITDTDFQGNPMFLVRREPCAGCGITDALDKSA